MTTDVGPDEWLWRRIHPANYKQNRVTSGAFTDPEMSVDIASIRLDKRLTLDDDSGRASQKAVGIAEFPTAAAHAQGLTVVHDPLENNQSHAIVRGPKTPAVKKALRNASTFVSRAEIENQ